MRFEIVKEWLRSKRLQKAADEIKHTDSEAAKAAEQSDSGSTTSSEGSSCPQTPTEPDPLEFMTPGLMEYLSQAEFVEAQVEAVQRTTEHRYRDAQHASESTDGLMARAAAVREKLKHLLRSLNSRDGAV